MESQSKMNIYQKLAKVRKAVEVIQKNAKGYGYTYVSEDEILAKTSGVMDKFDLSLIPSIVPGTFTAEPYTYSKLRVLKDGKTIEENITEIITKADMVFTWVNNENPDETVTVPWSMVGHQSDGSQGFGTALSYSYRYFLLKFFGVATTNDDVDSWRSKQKANEAAQDRAVAEEIIKQVDEYIRGYLEAHKDKAEEVKKLVSRYAKNGNYKAITESVLAAKLLNEIKEKFNDQDDQNVKKGK